MTNRITKKLLIAIVLLAAATPFTASGQTTANLESRQEFREAGFGIFIHWGIYSMLGDGEWALNDQNINYREYAGLAGGFYPAGFNAM